MAKYIIRIKSDVDKKVYCIPVEAENVHKARVGADEIFREKHGDKLPAVYVDN